VVVSVLNAYALGIGIALGIGKVRGRVWFLVAFLVANLVPQEGLVYPLYYLSKLVNLYDSQLALIIIFTAIQSAFGTYLLASVYAGLPTELLDAATRQINGLGGRRVRRNRGRRRPGIRSIGVHGAGVESRHREGVGSRAARRPGGRPPARHRASAGNRRRVRVHHRRRGAAMGGRPP
jgi:hypothetical protein